MSNAPYLRLCRRPCRTMLPKVAPWLAELGPMQEGLPLLMDRAYEGDETRHLVLIGHDPGGSAKVQPTSSLGK